MGRHADAANPMQAVTLGQLRSALPPHGPADSDDNGEEDSEQESQPEQKGPPSSKTPANTTKDDALKTCGKCCQQIKDSPDEFEESAGLYRMAAIGEKYIKALFICEQVYRFMFHF